MHILRRCCGETVFLRPGETSPAVSWPPQPQLSTTPPIEPAKFARASLTQRQTRRPPVGTIRSGLLVSRAAVACVHQETHALCERQSGYDLFSILGLYYNHNAACAGRCWLHKFEKKGEASLVYSNRLSVSFNFRCAGETAQRWAAPGENEGGAVVHYFWTCCGSHDSDSPGR